MATVCVDFDGVIHAYSQGWRDGTIYDEPVPGAFDALRDLMLNYSIAIFTTRDSGPVAEWVTKRSGILAYADDYHRSAFWNKRGEILVTNRKIAAVAYIDDRAIRFTTWPAALADLRASR